MENIKESQKKNCFFFTLDKYKELLNKIGIHAEVEVALDGISYFCDDGEDWTDGEVEMALSKYFDVNVTSIHADDCDYPGIWIAYKEKTDDPFLDKDDVRYYPDVESRKVYRVRVKSAHYDCEIAEPNDRGSSFFYSREKEELYESAKIAQAALERELLIRKVVHYLYKHQTINNNKFIEEVLGPGNHCVVSGENEFRYMYEHELERFSTGELEELYDRMSRRKKQ